jgi:hypothetical protein
MEQTTENIQDGINTNWFYEERGERKGPASESEIVRLIEQGKLSYGASVWKKDYPEWMKVENTELKSYLFNTTPPPLTGDHVNNTIVWILAFAPLIGLMLEYFVAGAVTGNQFDAQVGVSNGGYWFITLGLNIALGYFDENRLRKAGHDTSKFKGFAWLVPVYLFQRAKALKQNYAYFVVWIICFIVMLSA